MRNLPKGKLISLANNVAERLAGAVEDVAYGALGTFVDDMGLPEEETEMLIEKYDLMFLKLVISRLPSALGVD